MLSKKAKEDNNKEIVKDVGVMNITWEFLELSRKVLVLIQVSLM